MRQWLMHFAFRIDISLWIFVLAGFAALFIAAVTVSYQVLRVAMANPMKSLREQ
jgi:putative ABC transport system permease protein